MNALLISTLSWVIFLKALAYRKKPKAVTPQNPAINAGPEKY